MMSYDMRIMMQLRSWTSASDFGGQNAQSSENRPCHGDWISRFEAQGMGILQRMLKYSHAKVCPLLGRTPAT